MIGMNWDCHVLVEKWEPEAIRWARRRSGLVAPNGDQLLAMRVRPYEELEVHPGNALGRTGSATGLEMMMKRVFNVGTPPALSDNTHTGLGVGNSATGETTGDTALLGASKCWEPQDATYPQVTSTTGVVTLKATYSTAASDFAWAEYGSAIPNASGTTAVSAHDANGVPAGGYALLNRKAASLGTKSGGTWALTMTLTIT